MQSTNAFTGVMDLFISPAKAFNGLKDAKGWSFLAAALILISVAASQYIYHSSVSPEFLLEQQMERIEASGDFTPAELEMQESHMAQTLPMLGMLGAVFGGIAVLVFSAIFALYYYLVSKQDPNCEQKYGDWYGFTLFTSLPAIFAGLGTILLVVTASSSEIPLSVLSFSSLNQLILGLEPSSAFFGLAEAINIFTLWSVALCYVGLKAWTNFDNNKALIFALLPNVIIFGIWALIAAL